MPPAPARPSVEPAPAAPETPAIEDAGELQRKWSEAVHKVVAAQPARGGLLQSARAQSDDGETLTVAFPKGSAFALKMVSRPDSAAILVPIICSVFGQRTISYVMDAAPASASAPAPQPASAPAPSEDPDPEPASEAVPAPQPAQPLVDQATGPTIVPEPDVDAQRRAWEDEQVPYDDATIASYGIDEPAPAGASVAERPVSEAVSVPAPAQTAPVPNRSPLGALPWETPQAAAAAAGTLPSQQPAQPDFAATRPAPAPASSDDPGTPAEQAPWESTGDGRFADGVPQTEEDAKALIGSIFGSGVVFKDVEAE